MLKTIFTVLALATAAIATKDKPPVVTATVITTTTVCPVTSTFTDVSRLFV
jgi:hypothetical protein